MMNGSVHPRSKEIEQLIKQGYCLTSRKHGLVSRIDRPDWKEFLLEKYPNWGNGVLTDIQIADHYRRVYSKDIIELGSSKGRQFPSSGDSAVGFIKNA